MHTTAIYRLLYGSDFIGESLASVYDHVEQVMCFVGHEMFGGGRVIKYFGRDVYLPHDIDGVTSAIRQWKARFDRSNKVTVIDNPYATLLKGQVQRMVNELVLPRFVETTHILFVEADEVWRRDALSDLMEIAATGQDGSAVDEYLAQPLLFWRSPKFVSARSNPYCVMRALNGRKRIGPTGHALMSAGKDVTRFDTGLQVHNFGFAASERTVFWKHLTALSFSRDRGLDDAPREDWFEDVWRSWNWHSNRRIDLCPSAGHEYAFPPADEYPTDGLPESIQQRMVENPLKEWATAETSAQAEECRR